MKGPNLYGNTETNSPERSKTTAIEEALGFEDKEEKP